jgi:hypothetical protein
MKRMNRTIRAVLLGAVVAAVAHTACAQMVQFRRGDVLRAADLNQNFAVAQQRIDAQAKELAELKLICGGLALVSIAAVGFVARRRRRG